MKNMKTIIAAVLVGAFVSQPAMANGGKGSEQAQRTTAAAASATAAGSADSKKKYCFSMEARTGTHIPDYVCRTQAEWLAVGFDVHKKKYVK